MLPKKQTEILEYIKTYINDNDSAPSVREICTAVNLKSTSTVHSHLNQLETKGYITRNPAKYRSIELVKDINSPTNSDFTLVPIISKVSQNSSLLSSDNISGTFPLPTNIIEDSQHFMIYAKGDSMIDAGICNNDLILVKEQDKAVNGEIIVALIEEYITIKTYYKEKSFIRLQPANKNSSPIIMKDIKIIGKVVGLYRTF